MSKEENIIHYPSSPTKEAYVGHFKRPFQPIKDGYGFVGVLLQDSKREVVQCAKCGNWFAFLGAHIKHCLNITVREYKEKYGLNYTTGLISDELAKKRRDAYYINIEKVKVDGKKYLNPLKGKPKPTNYTERENKFGTCPLQLLTRTINFIKANEVLPSSRNRGKNLYAVIRRKYNGFPKALKAWGLPHYSGSGSSFEYIFPDGAREKINTKIKSSRELLYQMMLKKCPVLSAQDLTNYAINPITGKL
jgi:hypothetical protein